MCYYYEDLDIPTGNKKVGEKRMNNYLLKTKNLPPDLQETVNLLINSILDLASRVNSNMDSNSIGGIFHFSWG